MCTRDADTAHDGLWRAGTPAILGASLFWFGISVLARSYLEPTSALTALFTHCFRIFHFSPPMPFAEGLQLDPSSQFRLPSHTAPVCLNQCLFLK